jgi:hypothetical protein
MLAVCCSDGSTDIGMATKNPGFVGAAAQYLIMSKTLRKPSQATFKRAAKASPFQIGRGDAIDMAAHLP